MKRAIFTILFIISLFGMFGVSNVLTNILQAANNGEWKTADYLAVRILFDFVGYAILTKCDQIIRGSWKE